MSLGFEEQWDVVVNVNGILSERDEENRDILDSCFRALKPGGVLLGMFPTIFSAPYISYVDNDPDWLEVVDLERSAYYEDKQKLWQIFYTPLRLRRVLIESGFKLKKMEIFFCDSDYFLEL